MAIGKSFQPEETQDDEGINQDFWAHAEAWKEFHLSSSYWTEKHEQKIFHLKQC